MATVVFAAAAALANFGSVSDHASYNSGSRTDLPRYAPDTPPVGNTNIPSNSNDQPTTRGVQGIAGIWSVFAHDVSGVSTCSFAAAINDSKLLFTMMDGNKNDIFITLENPAWNVTFGKEISVSFNVDKRQPIILTARADASDTLHVIVNGKQSIAVLDGILKGSTLTVGFFDPAEPRWRVPLKGTKDVLAAQYLCMAGWQRLSD